MWPVVGGLLLLGLLTLWDSGVLKVKSKDGVIVVENVPENAVVEADGHNVSVGPVKGEPVRIEAPPGKHNVLVKRGRVVLLGQSVTLESGGSITLSVRKIAVKDAFLVLENVPAKAAVELDGQNVAVAAGSWQTLKIAAEPGWRAVVVRQGDDVRLAEGVTLKSGEEVTLRVARREPPVAQAPERLATVAPPAHVPSHDPGAQRETQALARTAPAPSQRPGAQWTSPSTGMTLVHIEGGEFLMGSPDDDKNAIDNEKPQHRVRLGPFLLGVTEVTQAQYKAAMGSTPSWYSPTGRGRTKIRANEATDRAPVENVSWYDAIQFCNTLSRKDRLEPYYTVQSSENVRLKNFRGVWHRYVDTILNVRVNNIKGAGYRLPTEAEWEYSCRAGTATKYSFGDDLSELGKYAWHSGNSGAMPHPVGLKRSNAFGLYDMHGNVWEWCWDGLDANNHPTSPVFDSRGPVGAVNRVFRGGCCVVGSPSCRSVYRGWDVFSRRGGALGFRVARSQSAR